MSQTNNQIFCPHCRGGNPPEAARCMWCGAAMQPQMPPTGSQSSKSACLVPVAVVFVAIIAIIVVNALSSRSTTVTGSSGYTSGSSSSSNSYTSYGSAGDEAAYRAKAYTWSQSYSNALGDFGDLNKTAQVNNAEWRSNMLITLASMRVTDSEVLNYSPPAKYAYVHSKMTQVARDMDEMTSLYAEGIDNNSAYFLQLAANKLNQVGADADAVTEELRNTR